MQRFRDENPKTEGAQRELARTDDEKDAKKSELHKLTFNLVWEPINCTRNSAIVTIIPAIFFKYYIKILFKWGPIDSVFNLIFGSVASKQNQSEHFFGKINHFSSIHFIATPARTNMY